MSAQEIDTSALRKARGAFFTPKPIADYLADWAVEGDPAATVLDPTCGESVFLEAAGHRLRELGVTPSALREQILGVDLHGQSVGESRSRLAKAGLDGTFAVEDFFGLSTPDRLDAVLPFVDAVIGNPPFVRYQKHVGADRKRAQQAALAQGVRLSGLASSWAALLVHACGFLKPEGRLAMVLPAELLSTGYAEPVRRWLKRRFKAVHLVMFEELQFQGATEKVLLVLARGTGGCNAFSLVPVSGAEDLRDLRMFGPSHLSVAPATEGKWTDFLLPVEDRQLFDRVLKEHFVPLSEYGSPSLGTVTGSNDFFCLSESVRRRYNIHERHLLPTSPPGTKHLKGLAFSKADWRRLHEAGDASVWMLQPDASMLNEPGLVRYLAEGQERGVPDAYKCRVRERWFRPPAAVPPDLFFTYMSHRYPRVIANTARVSFVNSMHGIRINARGSRTIVMQALPLLMHNSVTMMGAEVFGRSYGGGILKMEPSEAAQLPVPKLSVLKHAWDVLKTDKAKLDRSLSNGRWVSVVKRVDEALLSGAIELSESETVQLFEAARQLREQRMRPRSPAPKLA